MAFMLSDSEVKPFITKLNGINQLMKTMRYDSSYTIYNGMCFASPNGVNKPNVKGGFDKVDIGRTYSELNIDLGPLNSYTLFVQNGKLLYQFINQHKKNINKIVLECDTIDSSYLRLHTPDTVYLINASNGNRDVDNHNDMLRILYSETSYPNDNGRYVLTHEEIMMISKEKTIPLVLQYGEYRIRTTRKMLIGMTTSDEIELAIYQSAIPQYFFGVFTIFRKEMNIHHVYKFVKY